MINKNYNIKNNSQTIANKIILHILLISILLITVILIAGCEKDQISSEELEKKEFIVSKQTFELVQGQKEEFFVGINNKGEKDKFEFLVSCERGEDSCNGVFIQFFPNVEVNTNSKVALPLSFNIIDSAKQGEYVFKMVVKKGDHIFGEENLIVNVNEITKDYKSESSPLGLQD